MTELTPDKLLDAVNMERLWPERKRTIYCSITGRPWGKVSDEYVEYFIRNFGAREERDMEKIITRMTLFNGPSPLWQSKVPNMLLVNKHVDPAGFLVYMLNTVLRLEQAARLDLDLLVEWRNNMVDAYRDLNAMDHNFIHEINDALLLMTGEGLMPPLHILPSRELLPYCNKDKLVALLKMAKNYYKKYAGRLNQLPQGQTYGNKNLLHNRVNTANYSAEKLDVQTRDKLVEFMLLDILNNIDREHSTEAERKRALAVLGVPSPTLMLLRELEHNPPAILDKLAVKANVAKPGQEIKFKIGGGTK